MEGIVICLGRSAKRRLHKKLRECRDTRLVKRYLIILDLDEGWSPTEIARMLHVSRTTVYRVAQRFHEWGEAGLIDRREENGERKIDEKYLAVLYEVVASVATEHGWQRPTWTQEMLVTRLEEKMGVRIGLTAMSRALRKIGARRGRPKPTVGCPWSKTAKTRRLNAIARLLENLPPDQVAYYEDEVDIHLHPKIGLDWMVHGQQKEVLTPGKNEKRYLAGAQSVPDKELVWVEGGRKNSMLFIRLLWELVQRHPRARVIHVILDNYSIHHTQQVKTTLQTPLGRKIRLHFLPPYCPDDNQIERTWQDLHANVTRNHRCKSMEELMQQVHDYLRHHNGQETQPSYRMAA
jgi:putative transposase